MKKAKIVSLVLCIGVILLLIGCASTTSGKATSIEQAHPERLAKTYIGMDVNEFKTVWPEATRSGISDGRETYVFIYDHIFLYAPDYRIHTYFYFVENKLVGYDSERKGML